MTLIQNRIKLVESIILILINRKIPKNVTFIKNGSESVILIKKIQKNTKNIRLCLVRT